jgi:hypothetical protein
LTQSDILPLPPIATPLCSYSRAFFHRLCLGIRGLKRRAMSNDEPFALNDLSDQKKRPGFYKIEALSSRFSNSIHHAHVTTKLICGLSCLQVTSELFDAKGKLWAVSEVGSKRWSKWAQTFLVVSQMETDLLK